MRFLSLVIFSEGLNIMLFPPLPPSLPCILTPPPPTLKEIH